MLRAAATVIGLVLLLYGLILLAYSVYVLSEEFDMGLDRLFDSFWRPATAFTLISCVNGAVNMMFGLYAIMLSSSRQLLGSSYRVLVIALSVTGVYFIWGGIVDFLYLCVYLFGWDAGLTEYTIETALSGLVWLIGGVLLMLIPQRGVAPRYQPS